MKFTVLLVLACLQASAWSMAQTITLQEKNIPISKVFKEINRQTGYDCVYDVALFKDKTVSIDVTNASVEEVLSIVLAGMQVEYVIEDKAIVLSEKNVEQAVTANTSTVDFITVRGKVTDKKGEALPGVAVQVKGTTRGTVTDSNGEFSIDEVDDQSVLVFSFVGFKRIERPVDKLSQIEVTLEEDITSLDEVIVTAYGTTTDRANTSSISVVSGEQIRNLPERSFDRGLQGLVPGLLVTQGTGQPGGGLSNFIIRGITTNASPTGGSIVRNPLIVIDGVPVTQETNQMYISGARTPINNPLSQLNTADIESISVLKDAAAVSLYGSRAGNGVILVTTKKGRKGKTQVSIAHRVELTERADEIEMLNQDQYIELLKETYSNTERIIEGENVPYTEEEVQGILRQRYPSLNGKFYPQPDWESELYQRGVSNISNISAAGGSLSSSYYVNVDLTSQDGIVKGTGFERQSARVNLESDLNNWITLGLNSFLSKSQQRYSTGLSGGTETAVDVFSISPLFPVRDSTGTYIYNFTSDHLGRRLANPVAANELNINRIQSYRGLGKLFLRANIKDLVRLTTNVGFDFSSNESKEKVDPRLYDRVTFSTGGRIQEQDVRRANVIYTNLADLSKSLNRHNIDIKVGQEAQIINTRTIGVGVKNLTSFYYDQINSPGVTELTRTGVEVKETLLSYFSQANYNYDGKYYAIATLRRDGSSRFGEDKRYGTYWSIGAGWVISSERFLSSKKIIDFLKFRGSIGESGNAGAIDRFTPFDRIQAGRYLGDISVAPAGSEAGNPDVKWESTKSWDIGLELEMINSRIGFSADVYRKTTNDLIFSVPISGNTGFNSMLQNVGSMRNSGVELQLRLRPIIRPSFRWTIDMNLSTNKNILTKANNKALSQALGFTGNKEGEAFNSLYMYRWAGVNADNGRAQVYDSLGQITTDISSAKEEIVGKIQPDGFGGLTNSFEWKNWKLSAMLYFQYGYQLYLSSNYVHDGARPFANQSKVALDRWQKPGDVAANPKPTLFNSTTDFNSTRWLVDGDHVRLQTVSLGYSFSPTLLSKIGLRSGTIYIQSNNVALWTKSKLSFDPAMSTVYGGAGNSYPNSRAFGLGLDLTF